MDAILVALIALWANPAINRPWLSKLGSTLHHPESGAKAALFFLQIGVPENKLFIITFPNLIAIYCHLEAYALVAETHFLTNLPNNKKKRI